MESYICTNLCFVLFFWCCCCFSKSLNTVYLWQLFVKYGYVCAGKSPSQQFTAVIHMVTPLQSQISPVVKLIIAVAKSKFCAQVGSVSELCCELMLLRFRKEMKEWFHIYAVTCKQCQEVLILCDLKCFTWQLMFMLSMCFFYNLVSPYLPLSLFPFSFVSFLLFPSFFVFFI